MSEYLNQIKLLISKFENGQMEAIKNASIIVANVIKNDGIIHTLGTGHSQAIGMELFARASNIANVNAIMDEMVLLSGGARKASTIEQTNGVAEKLWNKYKIEKNDTIIIISNSGRNALPIEMAMKARKEGLKVIAITSLSQSKKYDSRHDSGKKLYQIADIVIDNCVPSGDGVLKSNNKLIGPASSILGILAINMIATEAIKINEQRGVQTPIFQSQNIDESNNNELFEKYESRIKHL